ncbi:MAG: GntP family permease [Chloroflexaceae bacterium]|nr:GntP family permease [Chloroflexaceae bacterium]
MLGIIGILLALVLLIVLAYRGVSLLVISPITALIAVLFAGGTPILATYTQIFMPAVGSFIVQFFPLFMLGALFGKLMEESGSAQVLARWIVDRLGSNQSVLAVVLACAVLTYGGVSLFVVAFAVYPIAVQLFREANIPKRLIPATIALGAFTFTMTALPGTPSIQNAIPMPFFGTTSFAAPGLGIISGAIMFALGLAWINWRVGQAHAANEGYSQTPEPTLTRTTELREHALGDGFDIAEIADERPNPAPPSFLIALAPLIMVIVFNLLLVAVIIPAMDTSFLALPKFGNTTIDEVRGLWAVIVALTCSIVALIFLNYQRISNIKAAINQGADASVLPIFNTASQVGFGAVIAALPGFVIIRDAVLQLGGDNVLVGLATSVGLLSAITGSASGGMSIVLETMGDTFVAQAEAAGVALDLVHRVTVMASGSIDSLPHSGAVISLLAICGLTHRESYFDIFVAAIVAPVISLIALIILGSIFGSF